MKSGKGLLCRCLLCFALFFVLTGLPGCGGQDPETQADAGDADSTDIEKIQDMFTEASTRWHYGDKAVLYDLEFEYLQEKYTFDEYLKFGQIQYLEADTLEQMVVRSVEFFGQDSATALVEAVFVGPTGDTTVFPDKYKVYYHRGRWIFPTVGVIEQQLQWEELRRVADSAAVAEEELEGL